MAPENPGHFSEKRTIVRLARCAAYVVFVLKSYGLIGGYRLYAVPDYESFEGRFSLNLSLFCMLVKNWNTRHENFLSMEWDICFYIRNFNQLIAFWN